MLSALRPCVSVTLLRHFTNDMTQKGTLIRLAVCCLLISCSRPAPFTTLQYDDFESQDTAPPPQTGASPGDRATPAQATPVAPPAGSPTSSELTRQPASGSGVAPSPQSDSDTSEDSEQPSELTRSSPAPPSELTRSSPAPPSELTRSSSAPPQS
ncbi:hypothetical protein BVRB_020240 [Beta vulgaris subsp. vulgaris]|uniref:Uncharacterized protein n=1 Tax=Beta vulgaris subsp. vulgaris TaxID=3555 RepID=A0A0J8B0P8_BETVV|nr:hypothetical protein BVRB_020240 [Beta vulgaris subsp. vulgaris]